MLNTKLRKLKKILKKMGNLLIAYSGGTDSTFLLKIAKDTIGDNVLAVIAKSETYPKREYRQAKKIVQELKIKHLVINTQELSNPHFLINSTNRCYYCKKELFTKLREIAYKKDINYVADGTNYDDINDFRPGINAIKELEIRSPLKEAFLTKKEIRLLSRKMELLTWDKPAFACLASRIPYGNKITLHKLKMINDAEDYIYNLGFRQVRVRHYLFSEQRRNNIARIEVSKEDIPRFTSIDLQEKVVKKLKQIGYHYITLDLEGYRIGSMNEILRKEKK